VPLPVATIDTLAFGGSGVCRIDGKVCFVPFSCPGDELSLRITSQKKSYSTAEIARILTPSSLRTTPVCPVFGECGGCNWQHISYAAQLAHKRNILAETFWRGPRVPAELIDNTEAAPFPYGYRCRSQFKVSLHGGSLRIGFYRHGSHQVVDTADGCPIAVSAINEVLTRFRAVLSSYPDVKLISQISIDAGENGIVAILHHTGKISAAGHTYLACQSGGLSPCSGLFFSTDQQSDPQKIWGSSELSYHLDRAGDNQAPMVLSYPPGGFSQVNQYQNSALLSVIRQLGAFAPTDTLLDLYCGNGNFSLPLATEVASVIGVEVTAASVHAAENNAQMNSVANTRFFCDDVARAVRRYADQGLEFDTVLLDPPRAGAGDALADIVRLQPQNIIYVSCDPNTLARDSGVLSGHGYHVVKSVPIDMFPQTYHLESVTLLRA
jgi:23S rRNA (uracil1939-C5)-methyltransferase